MACAPPPQTTAMSDPGMLRNPTAPLGGTSRFDGARFAGQWQTVACLGICAPQVIYSTTSDGELTRITPKGQVDYAVSAPGVLQDTSRDATLVVMWVDEGFRTAVVGDADGTWAAILDRRRPPGADRLKAATEILDFNGWDTGKLRKING
jgi:apolipoprotein D and lipocalin family protein